MRVIGTAGHVDHGKSTLIEALTGTHPDRLREEREREMTIVLGFAWLTLPNGEDVGIVDVPGHRDFIENMLSGIGAIDAVLFVVAADEGVMPQTREHLAIIDLLQIQGGVIALTKIDTVDDHEWLDLVETDIIDTVTGTVLENSPIVRVSAKKMEGINEIKEVLGNDLANKPLRVDYGKPRLPVDRVFSMSGFGTVVTGTLTDGQMNVGDEVSILPKKVRGRIRGLQTHKNKVDKAVPGSRTAINISGINIDQVKHGDVVVLPETYKSTRRVDVQFKLLSGISAPIKHNIEIKLFVGASEVLGRLRLLGAELIKPGEEGWLQLELKQPIVAVRGDRYIIRRPSPGETLGGGVVVDPNPTKRHKRFNKSVLDRLNSLIGGSPTDIILQTILASGICTVGLVKQRSDLSEDVAELAINELIIQNEVIRFQGKSERLLPNDLISTVSFWKQIHVKILDEIESYQKSFPLRLGIPREMLKSRIGFSPREYNALISEFVSGGELSETTIRENLPGISPVPVIHLPGQSIQFLPIHQKVVDKLIQEFSRDPYSPPTIKECISKAGEDIYNGLVDLEELIPVSDEVVFRFDAYQKMVSDVREIINKTGSISVSQARDRFKTSRRYILALLEHLDSVGLTIRKGDVRILKN